MLELLQLFFLFASFLVLGHLGFPKVWARVTPSPGGPSPAVEASPTLGRWSGAQAGTQSNQYIVALISWFSPVRSAPRHNCGNKINPSRMDGSFSGTVLHNSCPPGGRHPLFIGFFVPRRGSFCEYNGVGIFVDQSYSRRSRALVVDSHAAAYSVSQ